MDFVDNRSQLAKAPAALRTIRLCRNRAKKRCPQAACGQCVGWIDVHPHVSNIQSGKSHEKCLVCLGDTRSILHENIVNNAKGKTCFVEWAVFGMCAQVSAKNQLVASGVRAVPK